MNDKLKPDLMKLLGITDEKVADKVLHYAKLVNDGTTTMLVNSEGKKQAQNLLDGLRANDFAVAKALNERVNTIFDMFANNNSRTLDITAINKSYVLLVNSLKKIYKRNDELSAIERKPVWEYFDIIEGLEHEISNYTSDWDNDSGQAHLARVNKLCIVAGKETPDYTAELKQIVNDADKAITAFRKQLDEMKSNETVSQAEKDWFIPEYKLTYNINGNILVNDVLKIMRTHIGSASSKMMEQAENHPNTLFKPELGEKYSRNFSTTLSGMGFTVTLRALFFPTVSQDKGIVFRPVVSRATADAERIDTAKLDLQLKQLGADIEQRGISLDDIPF